MPKARAQPSDRVHSDRVHSDRVHSVGLHSVGLQTSVLALLGVLTPWLLSLGLLTSPLQAATPQATFALVPEMETPPGIVAQPHRERAVLQSRAGGLKGLTNLEDRVREDWSQIREIDIEALSRNQLEATRGWRLPADPGEWVGQVMAHEDGLWYLELRGPRLPARFDIVHRYLHVYASFDPVSGAVDDLTVTIRGWVLE